jgi:hypothetical protein
MERRAAPAPREDVSMRRITTTISTLLLAVTMAGCLVHTRDHRHWRDDGYRHRHYDDDGWRDRRRWDDDDRHRRDRRDDYWRRWR